MNLHDLLCKQDLCTNEEPSACITRCPLHVDIKSMIEEVAKGDFGKAYKILTKKLPFPNVMCRICDHVCESACVRQELGGCISIQELEKAIVKYGAGAPARSYPVPKNGKKVAVVGGGISGLTAAVDLDKKGYTVTIFEKESRLGGRMRSFSQDVISDEIINQELEFVNKGTIELKLNTQIKENEIDSLLKEYDAVYIGTGEKIDLKVDRVTFQTEKEGIFAGGRALDDDSVIASVSSGRRAAISIDRFTQKKSLTAARENEGAYESKLRLNTKNIPHVPPINVQTKEEDGYSREEAVKEAARCLRCQCMECARACNHLRKYNMTPKKYIRQINLNESVILGDHYANKMINSCTMCGLCGTVCSSHLDLKDIVAETRKSMVSRGKMPPSAHDFALKDMEFSNSEEFAMQKHQPGFDKSKYAFFPGCHLSSSSPEYVKKVYDYLTSSTDEGVGLMLGCCGSPAEWAGREELFQSSMKILKEKWEQMGKPIVITACSSCTNIFDRYASEMEIVSLWEYIVEHGLPKDYKKKEKRSFTIHDSCTTRYNEKLQNSVRDIVKELGHDVEELEYSKERTKCCGYGGLVYYANKEQAEEFIKERISESDKDYIAYCAMCRDLFASEGKRSVHLLDLIFGEDLDALSERKGPRLSERRAQRKKLKADLLEKWGISVSKKTDLGIIIKEEVKDLMESRWILSQDVEQVIEHAEAAGEKFLNPTTGHYLARKNILKVTFWVEYEKTEEGFIVHNAYSHRMEVLEG